VAQKELFSKYRYSKEKQFHQGEKKGQNGTGTKARAKRLKHTKQV